MTCAALHPLPASLLCEVDAVVSEIRARRPWRLDVDRLAGALGVRLAYSDLGPRLLGLTVDEDVVLLHRKLRGARRQFVFAHELAHVLCRRGRFEAVAPADEEWFADWFARELVLPRRWLLSTWSPTRPASLHVDLETVALQLSVLGICPPLMRNGGRVLCRTCGTGAHAWGCACRVWRRSDRDPCALPDIRELLRFRSPPGAHARLTIDVDAPAAVAAVA